MVEGEGFEPSKAVPADLQSAPFGRSGIPPNKMRRIMKHLLKGVKHFNIDLLKKIDTLAKQAKLRQAHTEFFSTLLPNC